MPEILLITRPLVSPWNEGSKNIAWNIASRGNNHQFQVLTIPNSDLAGNIGNIRYREIYTSRDLNRRQQFRLLWFLITKPVPSVDIFHTIFVPTPATSIPISLLSRIKRKGLIQTVPSLHRYITPKHNKTLFLSNHVVALSDWTAEKLTRWGIKHIYRINVGIDTDKFSPGSDKNTGRNKFGLKEDVTLVLYSGELTRLNSLSMMLSIVELVLRKSKNLHFVFASPTRLLGDLIARERAIQKVEALGFSDRVHFLGDVSDFSELLKISDMLVYPVSSMIGKFDTPLTVLEAMASELPVIISDLPPLNEILQGFAGIAVPPDNLKGFADAILELASDRVGRREMGGTGRMIVEEHFNINDMVHSYECLYNGFS